MKMLSRLRIDYRYQNWGKTERIVCEQDSNDDYTFLLLKQGQNVGTIFKQGNVWKSSSNNIFLPSDIANIGRFIDEHIALQQKPFDVMK